MRLIAHRGNINGRNKKRENEIVYILEALNLGYDAEIDIRYSRSKNDYFLGHDIMQEKCPKELLFNNKTWVHAKDIITFKNLLDQKVSNTFFHNNDDVVLTSSGFLWTYPGKELTEISIQVMPEYVNERFSSLCYGICSDVISNYQY